MKYQKNLFPLVFIIFLFLSSRLYVQAQPADNDLKLKEAVIEKRILDNGMTVLAQENPSHKLVALEIIVNTGSIFEGQWQGSGIAHLVEHMLFKGTKQRPEGQIAEEVSSLGGRINGYTSYQFTGYSLTIPANNFDKGLDILKDMITAPTFDKQQLQKEKEVILNEIRLNRDDPKRYLDRLFFQAAYSKAPFNLPIIGLEPLFTKLGQEDVVSFYNKWYVPNNIIVSVAGDIQAADVMEKVNAVFSDFKMQPYPQLTLPAIDDLVGPKGYEERFDINTTYMMLGFPSVSFSHPDSAALDVLSILLAQGQSSRLYKLLYKNKKLIYSVQGYNYTPGFRGVFAVNFMLDETNIKQVVDELFTEVDKIKAKGITATELNKSINSYLSEYIYSQQTVQDQAQTMAQDEAYAQNPHFSEKYLKKISRVTVKDVQRCAKLYLSPDKLIRVLLKPKGNTAEPVTAKSVVKPKPITKITLDNGLVLLLRNNSLQPTVSLQAIFSGGTRCETEQDNGIFHVLGRMLTRGTKKYTASDIAQILEDLGAEVSGFSGYNSFGLSMDVLSKDLDTGLNILVDLIANSTFPAPELSLEKRLSLKGIKIEDDDIYRNTVKILRKNLFKQYPYRFSTLGTEAAIASISRNQLIEYYNEYVRPNNLVIAIFGDIDLEHVTKVIKNKLGNLKPKSIRQKIHTAIKPPPSLKLINNQRDKKQALLMLGFLGADVKSADRYALEFLNSILCDSHGMLYKRIREKYGLSYALGGMSMSGVDTGYFFVYVATDPEATDEVKRIIIDEIKSLNTAPIDAQLIARTKSYLIGQQRINLETNSALSFISTLDELYGLGFGRYLDYETTINNLDAQTLQQAANKYLDITKSVIVITKDKF